jgi:folate-dependent phosphoribosylglycinamide formyltransferase PurN
MPIITIQTKSDDGIILSEKTYSVESDTGSFEILEAKVLEIRHSAFKEVTRSLLQQEQSSFEKSKKKTTKK